MFVSELISRPPLSRDYSRRTFPDHASPCPPLRSLPGIICHTSTIWENVLDLATPVRLSKGTMLYPDTKDRQPFFYLKKGKVRINKMDEEGKEFYPHYILSGSLIYDAFFLTCGQIPSMPLKMLEDSELHMFPSSMSFEDILSIHPHLARNMAYSQAVKDLAYSRLACINMSVKPFNRACIFLHEMYDIHRHGTFEPGVTQSELAMMLNMHKVTMANIISQLKREKIVGQFTKTKVSILEPARLKELGLKE